MCLCVVARVCLIVLFLSCASSLLLCVFVDCIMSLFVFVLLLCLCDCLFRFIVCFVVVDLFVLIVLC